MVDLSPYSFEKLREDREIAVFRGRRPDDGTSVLLMAAASEHPSSSIINRIKHVYSLRDGLNSAWAIRPLELLNLHGIPALLLDDPGGDFLDDVLRRSPSKEELLRLAIAIATALGSLHARQLIHRDVKPENIVANLATNNVWLTGFGLASHAPGYRQLPDPPEVIAGTLAYMAPEQTGRMNRSIDSRSDLYSLGVTLYEMFVGVLPFEASDAMGWVHCHIARLPVVPNLRRSEIPEPLSAIILKLLAKSPEERYQTAAGVEADLRLVLSAVEAGSPIESFPLGGHDVPTRLLIPEKLYGREREVDSLLAAFDQVVSQGTKELVLVSGYSGVGKSSVVNELHKALLLSGGIFTSGKFDQYKRDIPYATLAQAFQALVRQILVKSDAEVDHWRQALLEALGPNGQLIVNLIPEVEFVIGKQPPVAELPPQEARNRFQSVFKRFLSTFATAEHPLTLFLDDLQWLDTGTLELLERMITDPDVRHVLVIGAYRENEVSSSHPLMQTLAAIREAGTKTQEIVLAPLRLDDVHRLIVEALRCERKSIGPLAKLVHDKTGGNPFFAIQFLSALAEEGLLLFDGDAACWICNLDRVRAKGYSDNVVDLMVGKLRRLSDATQAALQQLACLGNVAEIATLSVVVGQSAEEIHTSLLEAVRAGLILRVEGSYAFLHDRIQEAAYALIPESARAEVHLRIGRKLLESLTADGLAEQLFDVANQLNRGTALLTDHDEKAHVASINLRAGRKAKASAAYASAREYFAAGMAVLDESDWTSRHELTFTLWLERAECELLTGDFDTAGQLIGGLMRRAASKIDEAAVGHLKVKFHVIKSEIQPAVEAALTCLRRLGIEIPAHPTEEQVQAEYETLGQALDVRSIESLIDLPLMTDPELAAATQILSVLAPPAYFADHRLFCLLPFRMVKISLQHGISRDSAYAFGNLGFILGWDRFRRYRDGYRFAKLACDLVEKYGFIADRAKVYLASGVLALWTRPIATAIDFYRTGFRAAIDTGDLTYACLCVYGTIAFLLVRNDPLDVVWRESETGLDFVQKARYRDAGDIIVSHQRFIATMRGRTATFSTFSDSRFDEATFEAQLTGDRNPMMICWYWILKLKARFLSADHAEALTAAGRAKPLLGASDGQVQPLDYFYYTALTLAALYETASADEQQAWRKLLREHQEQLREWAEINPPTFADKHALVLAEIARIDKRDSDALRLYEQAIHLARENGFVQNEALAHELAAQYYLTRGLETAGYAHLRNARNCYDRWGAHGKVKQLDKLYPRLPKEQTSTSAAIDGSSAGQLDVETIVKASQALSSEMVLPKFIEKLIRIAVENAGAERGLLVLLRGGEARIEAESNTGKGGIEVAVRQTAVTTSDLLQSALHYVIRTRERVLLDDASNDCVYSRDEYVLQKHSKSVLCLPIVKQTQLVGALYLENNLTRGAFTPDRVMVLQLLASQAAISLENAALYTDLQLQVGLLQHLPASAWTLKPDGTPDFVNQVWLEFSGQTLDFVRSHPEAWIAAVHPEEREIAAKIFWEGVHSGQGFAMETRSLRAKDGTYRWHLIQAVVLRDSEGKVLKFVGTTTDIDDQKRSEEALRQVQAELAHAARVTTMGELTASMAHEINQPLSGIITNAGTCLRMLASDPPNVDGARECAHRTIRDGNRASDVIKRLRALFSKKAPTIEWVDLNEATGEVITLLRSDLQRNQVTLSTELSDGLPVIQGDRVQLQQVILNLLLNASDAMRSVDDRPRKLVVRTESDQDDHVRLSVKDAGVGFGPQSVSKLFEPFYTTKNGGMGIGLSVSRSIIENHRGRMWASLNDGPGATFSFSIPCKAEGATAAHGLAAL